MKKIIIFTILIMLTGCFAPKEEPIIVALENLANAKNYTIELTGEIKTEEGNETLTGQIITDLENERSYVKMDMLTGGFSIESYTVNEDDKTITYSKTPFFSNFIKIVEDKEEFTDDLVPDFANKIEDLEYKKISTNDGVITYEVIFSDIDLVDMDDEEKQTYEDVTITFKVKNNQIISYTINADEENDFQTMEFKILNINETEVIIPDEVLNNAVSEEEAQFEIFKDFEFDFE